jgi:hypothetical protein
VTRHRFLFQTTSRNSKGSSQRPAPVKKKSSGKSEHSKTEVTGLARAFLARSMSFEVALFIDLRDVRATYWLPSPPRGPEACTVRVAGRTSVCQRLETKSWQLLGALI